MESIFEELGIPRKYLKCTVKDDRFIALVHNAWLKSLVKYSKLSEFIEKGKLELWPEDSNSTWTKIFIRLFKKRSAKVISLPRLRSLGIKDNPPLLFSQLMQYISQVNHKNLWKEAHKKYANVQDSYKDTHIILEDYNNVLKETLIRIYGCPIVNICDANLNIDMSNQFEAHLNVLPAVCCVETLNAIFVIHIPYFEHNLSDCVTFSPAILDKCHTKPLFIIYQLLQTFKAIHDNSLTVGDISLSDIYVNEDLWIYILPQITSNLYIQEPQKSDTYQTTIPDCRKFGHCFGKNMKCCYCGIKTFDKVQISNENLETVCNLWLSGQISNFTYISTLNKLSGRKLGDPNCHYVFPWVTDFASPCGKNWRDLKKSKYRINKGDRQLDLTYENSQLQVPHHVSDVLSSITYYVYMARRTPKPVLCKNVRTIWVPAEYPSSIQRMQEWTPDECIPEFFTDPSVFRSIHDDLDDLEVPLWCAGPEDFIEKHREALESHHVSERLHHWIDLTFGFKLTGNAAIKAKNVCLHIADEHSYLTKSGIIQLFNHPHPQKYSPSPFWSKLPPKLSTSRPVKQRVRDCSSSSMNVETESCKSEEEDYLEDHQSSGTGRSLGLTKLLSRSRSSLNEDTSPKTKSPHNGTHRSNSVGPKTPSFTLHVSSKSKTSPSASTTDTIPLPKEYKPEQALEFLEKKHLFFSKTFHPEQGKKYVFPKLDLQHRNGEDFTVKNAFTNMFFSETFENKFQKNKATKSLTFPMDNQNLVMYNKNQNCNNHKASNKSVCNYANIISARRIRELQILGCLIVEIFMAKQLRAMGSNSINLDFNDRLKNCLVVVKSCKNDLPPCVNYVVHLLLQPDVLNLADFKYPAVTDIGLPPPSAHLLLEPLLHSVVPFPKHFSRLYNLLKSLKDFKNVALELNILYHFDCNGYSCAEYEVLERTKVLFAQNIGECKVKNCAKDLEYLLEDLNPTTDVEIVNILLPHVKDLIEDAPTSVLAAWYLFDPFARALGPLITSSALLESVLKLYESEPNEATLPYYGKIAKLYHHSFLLRLIVRLGLKCFLDNFTVSLVEAVGRYRDYDKVDVILHTHSEKVIKKTSHLKTMDTESDVNSPNVFEQHGCNHVELAKDKEPEIFDFDEDKQNEEQLKSLIEHLELNISSDLPFNHSAAEEALDATIPENIDQLRNLEELNITIEEDSDTKPLMSPTIPIPPSYRSSELTNIACDVGSKKSESDSTSNKKSVSSQEEDALYSPSSSDHKNSENKSKIRRYEAKISDMSADSLIWLSHRLGPVLTARYLSRNLLKMLTLCYVGKENLVSIENSDAISIACSMVVGDDNAVKVLECLANIAGLYGEQLILFQYIPHMSELIALCKRKLTPNLEGGLISCFALLKHIVPYISDTTLMDQLQDVILKNIVNPTIRMLGSTKYMFPNGSTGRNVLARKYLDTMWMLAIRLGSDMTRTHLMVPALQRFFLIFDKIHANENYNYIEEQDKLQPQDTETSFMKSIEESHFIEVKRDGSTTEWAISGRPVKISHVRLKDSEGDSLSPPIGSQVVGSLSDDDPINQALDELKDVFNAELAHVAYLPFLKHVGLPSLEISLKNHDTIKDLCQEFEQNTNTLIRHFNKTQPPDTANQTATLSSSIGSNVALIGNRIEVQFPTNDNADLLSMVSNRMENNNRHLRGNWLAYWEHEIGRSDKDVMFNFKQIKLQTFTGHTQSVKCLYVLDNENSFMSGSRDKTVKLWSLRSQGDGSSVSNCQWTYSAHKKSILSITFVESMRLVASCDSVVHIWDPFMGVRVKYLESPKYAPVNVLKSMPAPSTLVYAATTEGTLKVLDTKQCSYIYELKLNANPSGLIRCLAIPISGLWVAAGQSSGYITVLDTRTGLIVSTWRAHEGEVLQLAVLDENTIISSSLDQAISVWNVPDGKFKFHMRGNTEPVHCLQTYNAELISGTTANRIGVHTSVDFEANFSSTKLRSDAFRGLLTSMALLPLNRLLLLGADTGNIHLLC